MRDSLSSPTIATNVCNMQWDGRLLSITAPKCARLCEALFCIFVCLVLSLVWKSLLNIRWCVLIWYISLNLGCLNTCSYWHMVNLCQDHVLSFHNSSTFTDIGMQNHLLEPVIWVSGIFLMRLVALAFICIHESVAWQLHGPVNFMNVGVYFYAIKYIQTVINNLES